MNTYLDDLAKVALHPPPPANGLTVMSTFAGGGGSCLGYRGAGFRELVAVEYMPRTAAILAANIDAHVICDDIARVTAAQMLEAGGVARGELDVLDGSPPCQGFSRANVGKRGIERNQMYVEQLRLIEGISPKVVVIENVPTMLDKANVWAWHEIYRELTALGYDVAGKILDASFLGVPQARKRLIIIGARRDLGLFAEDLYPRPDKHARTVREAFETVPGGDIVEAGRLSSKVLAACKPGEGLWNSLKVKEPGKWFNYGRLHYDRPSTTLTKRTAGVYHPAHDRLLTLPEGMRLQSWPDDYDWRDANHALAWGILGNSVPPLMMYRIARTIAGRLLRG